MPQKQGKKLPKRTGKRSGYKQKCYDRGEKRKDDRRIEGKRRHAINVQLRKDGLPTKWEAILAKQGPSTRNKHYDVGDRRYVTASAVKYPGKNQINPGRVVTVKSIRNATSAGVEGYSYRCWNCGERKQYLDKFFANSHGLAVAMAADHICSVDKWSPAKDQ